MLINIGQDWVLESDMAIRHRKVCRRVAAWLSTLIFCPTSGVRITPMNAQCAICDLGFAKGGQEPVCDLDVLERFDLQNRRIIKIGKDH